MPKPPAKQVDLHPSDWDKDWQPPIGNDPRPDEKPHIWQEFKRDLEMRRVAGEPIVGRGWPALLGIVAAIAVGLAYDSEWGRSILIGLRNLF